jgi:hypothetical protein
MWIVGILFHKNDKYDIIEHNGIKYYGECLFIYNTFEEVHTSLIPLHKAPEGSIIRIFNFSHIYN